MVEETKRHERPAASLARAGNNLLDPSRVFLLDLSSACSPDAQNELDAGSPLKYERA